MEPNYKELAEDLRYQYNKFTDLWDKALQQKTLKVTVMLNAPYLAREPSELDLFIEHVEKF